MDSIASSQVTLVDVLDRVLQRGLVVNADIIITLAGVPLIGINLRLALAGMETMVKYGVMKEWDDSILSQSWPAEKLAAPMPGRGIPPLTAAHSYEEVLCEKRQGP